MLFGEYSSTFHSDQQALWSQQAYAMIASPTRQAQRGETQAEIVVSFGVVHAAATAAGVYQYFVYVHEHLLLAVPFLENPW